jgi:hypothetical protein
LRIAVRQAWNLLGAGRYRRDLAAAAGGVDEELHLRVYPAAAMLPADGADADIG